VIRIVLLAAIAGWWALPQTAYASTATNIQITSLAPNPVVVGSTATAVASVTDVNNAPVAGDSVTFTDEVGNTTDNGDGTYTAQIQATTMAGVVQITATDNSTSPTPITSTAVGLGQTPGPAAIMTLSLTPASIVANGSSSTIAKATVTDASHNPLSGETVSFGQSGTPVTFFSFTCQTDSSGACSVKITGTSVGSTSITASDGAAQGQATLTETAGAAAAVTLAPLNPSTILGNGSSTTTATATVTDGLHPLGGQVVDFVTSGAPVSPSSSTCTTAANGTCSVTFTSTVVRSPATTTFTAEDGKVTSNQETLIQSSTTSSTSLVASSTSLVTNQPVTFFALVSSAGSIAGTVTFENHGAPIAGCTGDAVSSAATTSATCETSFAAAGSAAQVTAVFTPGPGSIAPGSSSGSLSVSVARDSSSVSVQLPGAGIVGQSLTYAAVVAPPPSRPGPYEPSGTVEFFDNGHPINSCTSQPLVNSIATCTLAYSRRGGHSISASYGGDANFTGSVSSATQITVQPYILGTIKSTLRWTFYYTPSYTKVIELLVKGTSVGDSLTVKCAGRGCPFAARVSVVTKGKRCGKGTKRKCRGGGVANLTSRLAGHRLSVGTKLTVVIDRTRWIAKYYAFTVRAGRGPRVKVSCLAPGHSKPGAGCSM
jgi:large repetitive protein